MSITFNDEAITLLKRIPFFSNFSEGDLPYVAEAILVKRCAAGETLFLQDDLGKGLHLLVEGLCKIYSISADGREQILYKLAPGDYCNEVSAVDGRTNPASCAAIQPSVVWILTEPALTELRQRFPALNDIIIISLADHARQLSRRVFQLSFLSVKERLILFLLQQCNEQGHIERRHWPQDEIASYLGTVRDVVGRAFKDLREEGLIEMNRLFIHIPDQQALRHLIH